MGPGEGASQEDKDNAFALGELIAKENWVLLTGGRKEGVMHAAAAGAKSANGITLGILPGSDGTDASECIDIAVITGMGSARNNINVLSSHMVIACGMGSGTASEIALALKARKQVILLTSDSEASAFFAKLGKQNIHIAVSPGAVIELVKSCLNI